MKCRLSPHVYVAAETVLKGGYAGVHAREENGGALLLLVTYSPAVWQVDVGSAAPDPQVGTDVSAQAKHASDSEEPTVTALP